MSGPVSEAPTRQESVAATQQPSAASSESATAPPGAVPVTLTELSLPGLLVPEPGREYQVETRDWHGAPCSFAIRFSPEAVAKLQSLGAGVDLATAEVRPAASEPIDLVHPQIRDRARRDEEKPPPLWIARGPHGYGVPAELAEVKLDATGQFTLQCKHLRYAETPREGEVFQGPALNDRGSTDQVLARFTPELTRWAVQQDAIVYEPRGEVIFPHRDTGPGLASTSFAQRYQKDTGHAPPVWVHRTVYETEWGPLSRPVHVLRDRLEILSPSPATAEELEPMEKQAWTQKGVEIAPKVFLYAPDEESAERFKQMFQEICGPSEAKRQPDELQSRLERVNGLLARFEEGPPSPDLLELCRQECGASAEGWGEEEARGRLKLLASRLSSMALPVHLFVVPEGKHFTSLPIFSDSIRALLVSELGYSSGCHLRSDVGHVVMTNKSNLTDKPGLARHELVHLLEDRYLEPEVLDRLDRIHSDILSQGGLLASSYGVRRKEFLTTMAEEHQGDFGPDGPAWVETAHGEVHGILLDAFQHQGPWPSDQVR
ncbi:MAG: hypothetical protein AMXMBFR33_51710 [Candidatus Xenobia bacterium]